MALWPRFVRMKIEKTEWRPNGSYEIDMVAEGDIMKTIGFSFGLDENRDEFDEADLTVGDYTVTLTSVELLQIIEGLESNLPERCSSQLKTA